MDCGLHDDYINNREHICQNPLCKDILIVTVATKEVPIEKISLLIQTLHLHKYPYLLLGRDDTWRGHFMNIEYAVKALTWINNKHKCKYVAFIDSIDTFFCHGPEILLKKMGVHDSIICGAEYWFSYKDEKGRDINNEELKSFFRKIWEGGNHKTLFPYPNAGFIMGRREELLEYYSKRDGFDDQAVLMDAMFENIPPKITLDYDADIIGNCTEIDRYNNWYADENGITEGFGHYPVAMHFPGRNLKEMQKLYDEYYSDSYFENFGEITLNSKKN